MVKWHSVHRKTVQIQCSFSFRVEVAIKESPSEPWFKMLLHLIALPLTLLKEVVLALNRLHLLDMPCRATVVRIGELLDTFGERSLFSVTALELKVCHPIASARSSLPLSHLCLKALGQCFTPFFPASFLF